MLCVHFAASKEGQIHLNGNSATYKRVLHEPLPDSDCNLTEEDGVVETASSSRDRSAIGPPIEKGPRSTSSGGNQARGDLLTGGAPSRVGQLHEMGPRSAISGKDHSLRPFCFLIPNMKVHTELLEQYAFKDDGRPIWNLTVLPASTSADAVDDFKCLNEMIQGLIGLLHTPNTSSSTSSSSFKGIPPVSRS